MVWHINKVRDVSDCKPAVGCQQSDAMAVVVDFKQSWALIQKGNKIKKKHVTQQRSQQFKTGFKETPLNNYTEMLMLYP